jgi:hypothetical protein
MEKKPNNENITKVLREHSEMYTLLKSFPEKISDLSAWQAKAKEMVVKVSRSE